MVKKLKISNLRYFRIKKRLGRAKARNIGIEKSKGELILFIDSDTIAEKNLIREHVKPHKNNRSIVIGYRKEFLNDKLINDQREIDFQSCNGNLNKLKNPWNLFYSCNVSVRKKHLIDVGMFDENFKKWGHEDWELGYRLYKKGLSFELNRKAVVIHHFHPREYKNYDEQRKFIKESANYFYRKHLDNEILSMTRQTEKIKVGKTCNNNCMYCLLSDKKNRKNLSLGEIKRTLDSIKDKDRLIISGGEPALREDIFEIIDYAKKIGFHEVILESNGRMFSYKNFCRKMVQARINQFNIYLYNHRAEVHDKITRVKGSWEQTVEGIKNLVHMDTVVQVNTFICRENYRDLLKFAKFLTELGVVHVKFNIFSYSFNPYTNFFEKFQIPTSSIFIKSINKIEKSGMFDHSIEFM